MKSAGRDARSGGVILLIVLVGVSACASAPAFRVAALVRVEGRGSWALRNAQEAARALSLRQNLQRLIRELRPGHLRMLDTDDPYSVLSDALVARPEGRGQVLVRIYGDSDWELLEICRALLNLWESGGILGVTPTSGLVARPWTKSGGKPTLEERKLARARADAEGGERRLYREKQRLLEEQITLGQQWQAADRQVELREKELLAARKVLAEREAELRRVQGILRQTPAERFRLLGDADALRLYGDMRGIEAALRRTGAVAERRPLEQLLARKRRALGLAQGRFELSARSQVEDGQTKLRAARRARDQSLHRRDALKQRRQALSRRVVQIGVEIGELRRRLKTIVGREELALGAAQGQGEVAVYRVRRVIRGCRSQRLSQD